jgi:hypothetical protein
MVQVRCVNGLRLLERIRLNDRGVPQRAYAVAGKELQAAHGLSTKINRDTVKFFVAVKITCSHVQV